MSEPVFDKQLIAIAKCQEALADFANFERWEILDYLSRRFGRYSYKLIDSEAGRHDPVSGAEDGK